jgi:NADPH:quinone reductase-like Zn-dependent oxidoreductase
MDGVYESTIDLSRLHASRLAIFGTSAQLRTAEHRIAAAQAYARDVLPLIAEGRFKPLVDRVFSFAEIPAAKAHMEANAHIGKIAVTIPA